MRTKEDIIAEIRRVEEIIGIDSGTVTYASLIGIIEVLADIRDIHYAIDERLVTINNSLENIGDPIRHIANNHGGNF